MYRLVACYASYFGAFTCVAWSPDGRFILARLLQRADISVTHWFLYQTGGQDDLLTLFSPWEQRVVARCQGHSSFVSAVAFDELRCDTRTYRFGSVGEDNKLILVRNRFDFLLACVLTFAVLQVGLLQRRTSPAEVPGQLGRICT